ncbi:hypothetical protein [Mesobacillus zeae]|uniref:Uncharacterized protein n=1 Tax=Mesobacillus zeae TaxID=1917180 RepID=A0A398BNK8_9BACI|nr:hypothetical protein [Mesobacillus zeae]RID88953.1 hypothetical protein D1970_00175 [Mesobacillus zeae]
MINETLEFYKSKLSRKEALLSKLQAKENNLDYEMAPNETIQLHVLQAEVRMLKEFVEDLGDLA